VKVCGDYSAQEVSNIIGDNVVYASCNCCNISYKYLEVLLIGILYIYIYIYIYVYIVD
jgi:hypothetical protein